MIPAPPWMRIACSLTATAVSLAIIGLANIAGSLGAGWLGQAHRMKWILFWMYGTRALAVAAYLLLPKNGSFGEEVIIDSAY